MRKDLDNMPTPPTSNIQPNPDPQDKKEEEKKEGDKPKIDPVIM
jgi:hypothetical protein